ncbi:MAG TPA: DUF1552 domain-containing protein [Planctomycetota bacterium]|nr:DUF1552 domain-containing protein [Planctomycetota bacterium]
MKMNTISRRALLRGAGAAVALPWLEAMTPAFGQSKSPVKPPVRLAWFYVPNGVHMPNWRPAEAGALKELPSILKSLEPVRKNVLVISDLAADHCIDYVAAHEPSGGGYLVGAKCKHSEEPEVGGTSIDQLAARQIGLKTPVDSLALGIDPGMRGDHGFSGTYLSNISWRSQNTPAALELNPKLLFDRLFRGQAPRRAHWGAEEPERPEKKSDSIESSVLDLVREDARTLQGRLGFSDRRKLEEYFEGLRSIEKRLDQAGKDGPVAKDDSAAQGKFSDLPHLTMPGGRGIPSSFAEHVTLMLDILTLAFQTDTTRVATFMFSCEKSGRSYPEIQVGSHHSISHHQGKPENHAMLTKINTLHMELFARMLGRMGQIWEGDSTLLDNVAICYGSAISDGNKHNHDDLPILLAGGCGGTLKGDRHVKLGKKTPICNLYLDMTTRAGADLKTFGDGSAPLGILG